MLMAIPSQPPEMGKCVETKGGSILPINVEDDDIVQTTNCEGSENYSGMSKLWVIGSNPIGITKNL